jgi:hypothetical protein
LLRGKDVDEIMELIREGLSIRLRAQSSALECVCYQGSTEDNEGRFGAFMARNSAKFAREQSIRLGRMLC